MEAAFFVFKLYVGLNVCKVIFFSKHFSGY